MATLQRGKNIQKIRRNENKNTHYLSNKEFTKEVVKYLKEKKKRKNVVMSDKLTNMFLQLIDNLAKKSNFKYYNYLEDMKQEAFLTCLKYIDNFDYNKTDNAFSYFTTVIYNAFLVYIKKENKLLDDHVDYCDLMLLKQEEDIKSQRVKIEKNEIIRNIEGF